MEQNATSADKIRQRMLKKRFDRHREILEKHKERGPAFKQAVERLERMFTEPTT
jgi:hypothetical protein